MVLIIAIGFTMYSMYTLQSAENKCNEHLITEYENLMEQVEKICPMIRTQMPGPINASLDSNYFG